MNRLGAPAILIGGVLAVCLGGSALARHAQSERERATIRFGVELDFVEVYAIVTDKDGRFVSNLTPEDFDVYEEGDQQEIATFSLVNVPVVRGAPVRFAEAVEPDVRSNTQVADGRVFVLVLDDLHTAAERSQRVVRAAHEFIDKHMGANDIAAVVHTGGTKHAAQEFTSNHALLKRAVEGFIGQKLRSATLAMLDEGVWERHRTFWDPYDAERVQRARSSLHVIEQLSNMLAAVHGRRKTIVCFGEGVDYDVHGGSSGSYAMHGPSTGRDVVVGATRQAIRAATRANVVLYTIDPRGLGGAIDDDTAFTVVFDDDKGPAPLTAPNRQSALQNELDLSHENLRTLAEETGGFAVLNDNDFASGLERLVEENSRYYLFGYSPTHTQHDGRYRRIEVKLRRPGLEVRARQGYVAPKKGEEAADGPDFEAPKGASPELARLAQSPLPDPGIAMRAVASPFRIADDRAIVPLVVEMDISGFAFREKEGKLLDTVEFSAVATDQRGKIQGSAHSDFQLAVRPETRQLLSEAGFRVIATLELPSGRYHVRMAALESGAGKGGTLFYDIEIPQYGKSDLVVTPLVVTSAVENLIPVIGSEKDKEKAILIPATRRRFARSDRLQVLAEVYPRFEAGSPPPLVELATRLKATDERVVFNRTEQRGGSELASPGAGIVHKVEVPLAGLASGEYLLETTARIVPHGPDQTQRVLIEVF